MALRKGEIYHFTITSLDGAETSTDRNKANATRRVKERIEEVRAPAEAILSLQKADEKLEPLTRFTKHLDDSVDVVPYPIP